MGWRSVKQKRNLLQVPSFGWSVKLVVFTHWFSGCGRVAGSRVMGRVSTEANVSNGTILTIIRKFVGRMGASLNGRRGICLHKFNDFVIGGETRGATQGVSGGAAVVVPTRGVPTFGPSSRFLAVMGVNGR